MNAVTHASEAEAHAALMLALEDAGMTLDELIEAHNRGRFESLDARMAWHVWLAVKS